MKTESAVALIPTLIAATSPKLDAARFEIRCVHFASAALIGQTRDHSKVQYLVDQGLIDAGQVADHPDRNKVYSCLGGMVDPVIDLSNRTVLRDGDIIVLCTDGLWGTIPGDEIASRLTTGAILKAAGRLRHSDEIDDRTGIVQ